jgi:hypothetical protein
MLEWYGTAIYTNGNSTTAPAGSNNASGATTTVTSALNVAHPKHATIVRSNMSQNTASRREWKGSLPDAWCAKVVIPHGAMPSRQERRNWPGWNKLNRPGASTGRSPTVSDQDTSRKKAPTARPQPENGHWDLEHSGHGRHHHDHRLLSSHGNRAVCLARVMLLLERALHFNVLGHLNAVPSPRDFSPFWVDCTQQ